MEESVKTDCMRAYECVLKLHAITLFDCISISTPFQVFAELSQANSQGYIRCNRPKVSEEEKAQEVTLSADAECPEEVRTVCEHLQEVTIYEHIE